MGWSKEKFIEHLDRYREWLATGVANVIEQEFTEKSSRPANCYKQLSKRLVNVLNNYLNSSGSMAVTGFSEPMLSLAKELNTARLAPSVQLRLIKNIRKVYIDSLSLGNLKDSCLRQCRAKVFAGFDQLELDTISAWETTDLKSREIEKRYLEGHDKLTGLISRSYLEEVLKSLNDESDLPLSIVIGDIDGLRLVNEKLGHQTGDLILQQVAKVFSEVARDNYMVARYGGDEFVLLMPKAGLDEAREASKEISRLCQELEWSTSKITITCGYATKESASQNWDLLVESAAHIMHRQKLFQGRSLRNEILSIVQNTLRIKSHETDDHASRMQEMITRMGNRLGLSDTELSDLALLSVLHDIGKIGIPDEILKKPGKLTEDEWEVIKRHPEIGCQIAKATPEISHIADAILSHHERWDGTGYPRGLKGLDIPLHARIIAIVDTFDVMTHERVYKKASTVEEAFNEIERCSGTQFQPELVKMFLELMASEINVDQ